MDRIKTLITKNVSKESTLVFTYMFLALLAALLIAGVIGIFTGDYFGFVIVGGSILCVAFGVSFALILKLASDRIVEYLYTE